MHTTVRELCPSFISRRFAFDITGARQLLGWQPKHSLRDALPKMVAALKADPLGFYRENDLKPPDDLRAREETVSDKRVP